MSPTYIIHKRLLNMCCSVKTNVALSYPVEEKPEIFGSEGVERPRGQHVEQAEFHLLQSLLLTRHHSKDTFEEYLN